MPSSSRLHHRRGTSSFRRPSGHNRDKPELRSSARGGHRGHAIRGALPSIFLEKRNPHAP
uniref:Uncharacterized protein n=1 Tax=Oryza rufipogon TaxID=4529 RepID=A0A0E0RG79_ORYRU